MKFRKPSRKILAGCALEPLEARQLFSTFHVTNTNDSGSGSLREAITDVNKDPGSSETIAFAIQPTNEPAAISPKSALPVITHGNVTINGQTQNTSTLYPIELAGGLTLSGSGEHVSALSIAAGSGADITLENGGSSFVQGCSLQVPGGGSGIVVNNSSLNTLGEFNATGSPESQANVFKGISTGDGILIEGGSNSNFAIGNSVINCGYGIDVTSSAYDTHLISNYVALNLRGGIADAGSGADIESNTLVSNNDDDIIESGSSNFLHGNSITYSDNGVDITATATATQIENNQISNSGIGILVQGGGESIIAENTISVNSHYGILLANGTGTPWIEQNSIFSNTTGIGRQAGDDALTSVPTIGLVTDLLGKLTIHFTCQGPANGQCNLEFFASDSGTTSDGKDFLGRTTVDFDKNGNLSGTVTFSTPINSGVVTATARNAYGTGVFSNAAIYEPLNTGAGFGG